jgi:hypothetical protein
VGGGGAAANNRHTIIRGRRAAEPVDGTQEDTPACLPACLLTALPLTCLLTAILLPSQTAPHCMIIHCSWA